MISLSRNSYTLWKIARDAGFTPRELSSSYKNSKYYIEIERLISNAIAVCYTGKEDPESIITALHQLHDLGIRPQFVDYNQMFIEDGTVLFLTTMYSKVNGEFNRDEFSAMIAFLTSTTHSKKNVHKNEIVMYMQAADIGAAPEVIEVLGKDTLVTHRYPYSLMDASMNAVKLTEKAKLSLEAKMRSLHFLGIIHRDITEENFVCNLDGSEAWIIDFGLSVRVDTVSLDILVKYIGDFEYEEEIDGDRNNLVSIVKQLEIKGLVNLLRHF